MDEKDNGLVSLVAPMYNEEEVIGLFFATVEEILDKAKIPYEVICVNDGSTDNTLSSLKGYSESDPRIKIVNLSRNYGKEVALTAGLDHARGAAVIPIDCDLQDPPDLIPKMYEKWREGYQVVLAKRIDRASDSPGKRFSSSLFYKMITKISDIDIPENVGDYRLLDRQVVNALKEFPERSRFMKGLFASLGFRQTTVDYLRPERAAGTTKWNYWKLYKLAIEGIISFTSFPLKIWSYLGATMALGASIYAIYLIVKTVVLGIDVPGYASLRVVILFSSSAILICLGVIGEYLSRIFIEVKQRPLYIVMEKVGFDD